MATNQPSQRSAATETTGMFTSDTEDSISTAAGLHDLVTDEIFPTQEPSKYPSVIC